MYPVSNAFLEAVKTNNRKYYWTGRITTTAGTVYEFDQNDMVKGSGYITSQCCGSTEIELGTVYAAEMGISLFSEINRYTLEDAKVELFYHLPVAYASNDVNATANVQRGSMNLTESMALDDGYKFVWEFTPSQGNGTIAAVGLTSKHGGANAYGSSAAVDTGLLLLRQNSLSLDVSWLNVLFRTVEVDFENGLLYSIAYSSSTVSISRYRIPVFDIGLNEKLDDTTLTLEDTTVLQCSTFSFYGSYTPYGTFLDGGDGYWYGFSKSQKGAYKILDNAKKCADQNPGYKVFDADGKVVYEPKAAEPAVKVPFLVKVSISDLNIRKGPGTDYSRVQFCPVGVYTIVEVKVGQGSKAGWGRLKSGIGWLSLDFCQRL